MLKQSKETTLRQRADLTNQIMSSLKAYEAQGDQAVACGASFIAEFLAARSSAQLSPLLGHEAVASLAAANAAFVSGLGHIAAAHERLRALPEKIGLEAVGWGEVEDSPGAYNAPQARLKAV